MNELRFFVPGTPAPQGSKKAFSRKGTTRVQMVESSKKVKPWRAAVEAAAREALLYSASWEPGTDAPLYMDVTFLLPAPKRIPANRRGWPTTIPDSDKLWRSTNDALTTAGVWKDDSVVVKWAGSKTYSSQTGALIALTELPQFLVPKEAA